MNSRTSPSSRRSRSRRRRSSSVRAGRVALDQALDVRRPGRWRSSGPGPVRRGSRARSGPVSASSRLEVEASWPPSTSEYRGRSWRRSHGQTDLVDDVVSSGSVPTAGVRRPRSTGRKHSAPGAPAVEDRPASASAVGAGRGSGSACPGTSRARSRTSSGGSSGRARRRDALRLGEPDREVADDRAGRRSSGCADRRHPRAELARTCAAVAREPPPNVGQQHDREQQRRREDAERGPEPGDRLGPAAPAPEPGEPASSASERRQDDQRRGPGRPRAGTCPTSSATGNSRLVTRNVIRLISSTTAGARGRGPATAAPGARSTETGSPSSSSTLTRLCDEPVDPHLEQPGRPDGEVAGRVGGSFQAKMSKPVTERALVTAWPGQRAAEDDPVAVSPTARRPARATTATTGDQPDAHRRATPRPRPAP